MRISDWSSDVCSSDLAPVAQAVRAGVGDATLPLPGDHRLQGGGPSRKGFAMHQIAPEIEGGDMRQPGVGIGIAHIQHIAPEQADGAEARADADARSEEHTSELQSLMRISYAVFCLKKKNRNTNNKAVQKLHRLQ